MILSKWAGQCVYRSATQPVGTVSAIHVDVVARPQIQHAGHDSIATRVLEEDIHGAQVMADQHDPVALRAAFTHSDEPRGSGLVHLPSCRQHSRGNSDSVVAEVACEHTASRWRSRSDSQRSEGTGCPDRHGQREREHGSGAASETDRPASDTGDCSPTCSLRHVSLLDELFTPLNCAPLRFSLVLPEFAGSLRRDLVAANECDVTSDVTSSQPQAHAVSRTIAEERGLDHSFAELAATRPLPPEVVHRLLLNHLRGCSALVEGVADTFELLDDKPQLVGEALKGVFETGNIRGWIAAHAAHDTRRAA